MENQDPGCKTCKQTSNKANLTSFWFAFLGIYLLFTSVYGTIEIVKSIVHLFQR
jgi:hypothetical protein